MRLTSADGGTDVITIGEQRAGRAGWASRAGRDGRPQVAVVGAGVAGLTAAYLLQQAYDVTLYEAEDRLGGHAHTHDIATADGRLLPLDTGFIVHHARTYPSLIRLFGELGVTTRDTQLGFGPTFQRMWNLYLAYSEAGFRAGYLDVHQLLLERGW